MKVLFVARPDIRSAPGGDTVQMECTAACLRKLGVEVTIADSTVTDDSAFDLIHFFNIIDPEDLLGMAMRTRKPYVISTIYVNYAEYDRNHRTDWIGRLSRVLSYDAVEYVKTVGKVVLKGERVSTWKYFLMGHGESVRYLLRHAACLLPNSESEYQRLARDYGTTCGYAVVTNAVDPSAFGRSLSSRTREGVLCAGRMEGRKNQLNLVRAMNGTGIPVYIAGQVSENQKAYEAQCRAEAGNNVSFLGHIPQQQLRQLYGNVKVHALPSWFETTGLSSLEAAAMGCNVVVGDKGDVREYFGDFAYYCDPGNPDSIRTAILEAYSNPVNPALKEHVLQHCTWEKAAEQTLAVYQKVAAENKS